ncbi:hypothetical protein C5B96_00330 [Subtercola sp. Z020]|uniref:SRPBCC family protein n=1 Tax=Subtercola sp. Z020 TaxID=2080582 RepID=UPI000CE87D94|nr:SRPBCC family protein [Subtercola sp. Z020]PPF90092.1 hypothetical protein C5B96_00330 [Subtercola sp. Z020]
MKRAEHSVELPVSASAAFDLWEQIETFPSFMRHVVRISRLDDRSSYWELEIGGVEWDFEVQVTAREPGHYLQWATEAGEIVFTGSVDFTALDAATSRVRVLIEWEPTGLLERVGAALGDDSRVLRQDLDDLRIHVEAQTQTPSADRS